MHYIKSPISVHFSVTGSLYNWYKVQFYDDIDKDDDNNKDVVLLDTDKHWVVEGIPGAQT